MTSMWILVAGDGEYSGRTETPVAAFADRDEALAARDELATLARLADTARRTHPKGMYTNEAYATRAPFNEQAKALGFDKCAEDYEVVEVPVMVWPHG